MPTDGENPEFVQFVMRRFNLVRYLRLHGFRLVKDHGVWIVRDIGADGKTERDSGHSEKN